MGLINGGGEQQFECEVHRCWFPRRLGGGSFRALLQLFPLQLRGEGADFTVCFFLFESVNHLIMGSTPSFVLMSEERGGENTNV